MIKSTMTIPIITWEEVESYGSLMNNFTLGQTPEDQDIMKEKSWQIGIIALYIVVIITGFFENLTTLIVLLKNKQLHKSGNIFIMGLAMSDILLCSFNLPLLLYHQLTEMWPFFFGGGILCKVVKSIHGIPIFVSSVSILMIAIDRYKLIVHPSRKAMTKCTATVMVVCLTVLAITFQLPIIVHTEYHVVDIPALQIYKELCIEKWPDVRLRHAYSVACAVIQYCVPMTVTSVLYWRISTSLPNGPTRRANGRNRKTNKILITIVISFTLCWLPWNIENILVEFTPHIFSGRYFKLTDLLVGILAMGSSCINPFLYAWMNKNFRKALMVCVRKARRNGDNGQNGQRLLGNRFAINCHETRV